MSQAKSPVDSGTTADRLASMAHETIDSITPKANRAEDEVRGAATRVADSAKHLHDTTENMLRTARSYAASNSLAVAAVAFAVGVLLTVWSRR